MTDEEFKGLCNTALKFVQEKAPNPKTRGAGYYKNAYGNWCKCSTGNLAFNATKLEVVSEIEAFIGVDKDVAPYMPYTNEPWISPKWNGKKNPNEKWFDKTAKELAEHLATLYDGKLVIVK